MVLSQDLTLIDLFSGKGNLARAYRLKPSFQSWIFWLIKKVVLIRAHTLVILSRFIWNGLPPITQVHGSHGSKASGVSNGEGPRSKSLPWWATRQGHQNRKIKKGWMGWYDKHVHMRVKFLVCDLETTINSDHHHNTIFTFYKNEDPSNEQC